MITFYQYFLENRSVIWTVLGVLPNLNFFGVVFKYLEDASEEACDADGVYVVFYCRIRGGGSVLRTGGRSFDNKLHSGIRWWAVCRVFSGQLQFGEGVLFILWRYERKLP